VGELLARAWGRTVEVSAPADVLAWVRNDLPHGWEPLAQGKPERRWRVRRTGTGTGTATAFSAETILTRDATPRAAAQAVADDLELWVAEHARDLIFVHAGVVVVDGRAMLLPGPSRAGKSTLAAALVRSGAEYFSDEFAPLDRHGHVHPYARTPRQRPDSPAAAWSAPDQPPHRATGGVPVALVAEVAYRTPVLQPLDVVTPGQGVMALLRNTVPAISRRTEALDVATTVARSSTCLAGDRGDPLACAEVLLAALAEARIPDHRPSSPNSVLSAIE
jgi:hypothetical protein